ncbi:MAG TPA: hypothetical protein VKT75_08395 [Acidobacteriaceae bacterium]|nr:hypothetical protein [Acidobacteriaceae bacterium]
MLVRRLAVVLCPLSAALLFSQTPPHSAPPVKAAPRDGVELPVRRVVLYKNGVGYFEHSGRVTGNQAITVDFTSSQLDDALQSLTALDLGGGRIAGVSYNSNTPFDQQLKNIPLGLDDNPDTADLYGALRGARVEVSGAGEGVTAGRIVDYESRTEKTASGGETDRRFLTVVTDTGAIRTFEVTPATSVRVIDGDLRRDLDDYLKLLASTETRQMRHLTLQANGAGARDIRVSYISEVPVWKTTYRIVFPPAQTNASAPAGGSESAILQGWAVVDNTVGSDWDNVQLSLVAGAPQSFTEPLSQPIYTTRPSIPVPEAENIAPTTHEGALEATPAAPQMVQLKGQGSGYGAGVGGGILSGSGNGIGQGNGGGYGRGVMGGILGALRNAPPAPLPTVQDESASASSSAFDDYFEYTVAQPVTIRRNESALVPVLQTNVDAERVTLWNASQPVPLRALWLTNSSKLTLDRGSFSIFENGEFAGEGITDPIHAGEKRLLSYAVDQAVHITSEGQNFTSHLRHLTVHDGYLIERMEQARDVTYVVHNTAADARTVILEHPVQNGWRLSSDTKPVETTATLYRFRVTAQPGETVRLHVGQTHTEGTRYQLTAVSDDQLQIILTGSGNRAAIEQALAPVLAARAIVHDLDTQIAQQDTEIDRGEQDSTRLHNNIGGLKDSAEERALARRYAGEMNADEDQLQALRKHRADLEQQRTAAQHALDEAIRNLDLDQDV